MDPSKIPTVTLDDLNAFHQTHFGSPAPTSSTTNTTEPEEEADDGLGYYSDGVKRTLTDEQIAMFRHSEIQRLLQKRRLRREAEEEAAEEAAEAAAVAAEQPADSPTVQLADKYQGRSGAPKNAASDPSRAKSKFDYKNEPVSRRTPHRRARELDEVKTQGIELDY